MVSPLVLARRANVDSPAIGTCVTPLDRFDGTEAWTVMLNDKTQA